MTRMHKAQRLINHVALVLDGSGSMNGHEKKLIQVADDQIKHLALRSEELQQETRVSVYVFDDVVDCLIFDMDVMRLPSIADLYTVDGLTALLDATIKSQEDLDTTSQLYGDHGFLTFVLTDGQENKSRHSVFDFQSTLRKHSNKTVAFLVPDSSGEVYLTRLGVSRDNISRWNTASATGIVDAVSTIRTATENYMTSRASGTYTPNRGVFSTGTDAVNDRTVQTALTPLDPRDYALVPVHYNAQISEFLRDAGYAGKVGSGYYQLTKREEIQPQKDVIIVNKHTNQAYGGREARNIIGLSNTYQRVSPNVNPDYDVYIQSTSVNRKLIPGSKVLVKTR